MIRISEDGKTFVDIKSWEDILSRPGFKQKLDPNLIILKQIIGQYSINPKQPCGLRSCGTKHNRGYLVVADGGLETNIGNVCGKKIFGVEFNQLHDVFKRSLNEQRYREEILETQNQLDDIVEKVEILRNGDFGGDKSYENMHWHITKGFPESICTPLIERAKRGENIVSREVRLSEEERKMLPIARKNDRFRAETIFIIAGIKAVIDYPRLRTILHKRLGNELEEFRNLDVPSLNYINLQHWNNWKNKINTRLKEASNIIDDCRRFLESTNIERIRNYRQYL
jgi:hypothetical protein